MKAQTALLVVIVSLCSCHKQVEPSGDKFLHLSEFLSMLSREKTYVITNYYTSNASLTIPPVNVDDTYTFDMASNRDGSVKSLEPCIEYHYNFRAYESNFSILFDWVDFNIVPQTYELYDYKVDEWFILRKGDTYTKYQIIYHPYLATR